MDKLLLEKLKLLETDFDAIEDSHLRSVLQFLQNALERSLTEIHKLREENQQLRDENNRLKGEQGKPSIRPQAQSGDISSEKERATPKTPPLKK